MGFVVLWFAQDPAELYKRCDSLIPWFSDGVDLEDGTPKANFGTVNRGELLDRAKREAARRNRLILWYCMRVPGTHTYRAPILDAYARVALFTDPTLADLVKSKFVPVRMACDEALSNAVGIRAPAFLEPGFIFLTPQGRVVHTLDRIRTFNAAWFRLAMIEVLSKFPEYNAPVGSSVEDLIRGGDDEKAMAGASPEERAVILRLSGRYREVLALDCSPIHKGAAFLGVGDLPGARKILEREDSAEALYLLAAIEWHEGGEPDALWKKAVLRFPESPWAWRSASNLVYGRDGCRMGPLPHRFETLAVLPPQGAPTSTCMPARNLDTAAARAIELLLGAQRPDGSWSDARYSYGWAAYMIRRRIQEGRLDPGYKVWPDLSLHPNYYVAVTALAASALAEWRDAAPERIDRALRRAERYILDDSHLAPDRCEECFAETFRLWYAAKKNYQSHMNRIVLRLAKLQDSDGFWGHEYPSAFATAGVVHCLVQARQAGADVPESLLQRAADGLLKTRHEDGRQDYRHEPGHPPSSARNSMGRTALSQLALYECGRLSRDSVASGVQAYWKHLDLLHAIRLCDNHADQELAGFFYFYAFFHALEAARALVEPERSLNLKKFRAEILSLPEIDGSFVDSHELGKSYGTAMALLILKRVQ